MTGRLTYPILAWLCVLAIGGFYAWIAIAPFDYAAAPIVATLLLCIAIGILKLGVREPVDYWEAEAAPPQAGRVGLMVLTAAILQFALDAGSARLGLTDQTISMANYLGVWLVVPLAFLASGLVRWPRRRARPRTRDFLLVSGLALLLAAGLCYLSTVNVDAPRTAPTAMEIMIDGGAVLLGATLEEVVYRVLLLTALVKASGSRFQALILSSVVFALVHVPPVFSTPLALQDWSMLQFYATQFLPELVLIIAMGFVFSALWLRTGSIVLVVVFHTICNLAPIVVAALHASKG